MFRIEVIGNLGADCEVRNEGGRKFYTFKVAHSETWADNNGTQHERTIWVSCIMNETLGAAVSKFLTRGRKVYVRGRGDLRTYSSKIDRCIKAGASISVDELELIGSQSEAVPREVIDPENGLIYETYKAFYLDASKFPKGKYPAEFVSKQGARFSCDKGFLYPVAEQQSQDEQQAF